MQTAARHVSERLEQLADTLSRELNDPEHMSSNRTQLYRLWQRSHLAEDAFLDLAYEARARTKYRANIDKPAAKSAFLPGSRNRAPYFFRVLRSMIDELAASMPANSLTTDGTCSNVPDTPIRRLSAFSLTLTIAPDGTAHSTQSIDLPPGRYRGVLVVGIGSGIQQTCSEHEDVSP
jgi:hypothetical protein